MANHKKAIFDFGNAGCPSCKRAIEHAGKHIEGISSIDVDIASHRIIVDYDENAENALQELKDIVRKIGYDMTLVA
jgi:Cu+-exporting ATPase